MNRLGPALLAALLLGGAGPAAPDGPLPGAPAEAPPAPAVLGPLPDPGAGRRPGPLRLDPLPPGLEALPDGSIRLPFAAGADRPAEAALPALAELGRRFAQVPDGRVTLVAQASAPLHDVSTARRLTLQRGLAVKAALAAGGVAETRIDIRPMGRLPAGIDAVDLQPPGWQPPPLPLPGAVPAR